MLTRSSKSLLSVSDRQKIIPVIENRTEFLRALNAPQISTVLLRHCNLLDLKPIIDHAFEHEDPINAGVTSPHSFQNGDVRVFFHDQHN